MTDDNVNSFNSVLVHEIRHWDILQCHDDRLWWMDQQLSFFSMPSSLNPSLRLCEVENGGTGGLSGSCGTSVVRHSGNLESMGLMDEESETSMRRQCGK